MEGHIHGCAQKEKVGQVDWASAFLGVWGTRHPVIPVEVN